MFEIHRSPKNGQFYFRLKARNHQIILTSQGYKAKASCKKGIRAVQTRAASEQNFERKVAGNGKPYFTLDARNGDVVGTSQMYANTTSMRKGIRSVMANAPGAETRDMTHWQEA